MKKFLSMLIVVGMLASFSYAHMGMDSPKAKAVTLTGLLVDSNCYLKEGHTNDDHDSMRKCGHDCLKDGLPAGILVDKKLYVLIFPGYVFADFVGKTLEISGNLVGGDFLIPEKAFLVEKSGKKPIKLKGKVMM